MKSRLEAPSGSAALNAPDFMQTEVQIRVWTEEAERSGATLEDGVYCK